MGSGASHASTAAGKRRTGEGSSKKPSRLRALLLRAGSGRRVVGHRESTELQGPRRTLCNGLDDDVLSEVTSTSKCDDSMVLPSCGDGLPPPNAQRRVHLAMLFSVEDEAFSYGGGVMSTDGLPNTHGRVEHGSLPFIASNVEEPSRGRRHNAFSFTDVNTHVDEVDATTKMEEMEVGPSQGNGTASDGQSQGFAAVLNTAASSWRERKTNMWPDGLMNCSLRRIFVTTLIGHPTRVRSISIAPNESSFVSCQRGDASVTMQSLANGKVEGFFAGHCDAVVSITFSPDGRRLATTSKDCTIAIWDVLVQRLLIVLHHRKMAICCCFSPDSRMVVSGSYDFACRLWDVRHVKEVLAYKHHKGFIVSVAYNPDGNSICSASADKTLRVWSSTTGRTRLILRGHVGIVLSCSYSSDGKHIISNDNALLFVWSATDGTCKWRLAATDFVSKQYMKCSMGKLGWMFSCAAPGPFSQYLVIACSNRFVYVLNIYTGEECASTLCRAPVYCLSRGSCSKVAFGDNFGNIYVQTLS